VTIKIDTEIKVIVRARVGTAVAGTSISASVLFEIVMKVKGKDGWSSWTLILTLVKQEIIQHYSSYSNLSVYIVVGTSSKYPVPESFQNTPIRGYEKLAVMVSIMSDNGKELVSRG